ncbi:trehalose-phosphatase [Streptomyces californicus]
MRRRFAGVPGLEHLVVLGHYGAERWDAGPVPSRPARTRRRRRTAELPAARSRASGTALDRGEGQAVAVHTRRADDPQAAFEALRAPLGELAARHGLIVEPGRLVLELRPPGMDKGVALARFVAELDAESVIYAGDDLGDLAAFAAVEKLRTGGADGIPGLLVCSGSTEVPELAARADLSVPGPASVVEFLAALAERL